eukprot:6601121-Karenia_brevis.AAC.1
MPYLSRSFWTWPAIASTIRAEAQYSDFQAIVDDVCTGSLDQAGGLQGRVRVALEKHIYNDSLQNLLAARCNKYLSED